MFNRYDNTINADEGIRMPSNALDVRVDSLTISELVGRYEDFTDPAKAWRTRFPWAERFVMGYPLPAWQRPMVWTEAQMVRFIESIWSGVDIGTYLVNKNWEFVRGKDEFVLFSEVLLDGQQRLTSIERYLNSDFAVPDQNGVLRKWAELGKIERRRFCNRGFARASVQTWDEKELRMVYDLRSFGGTAHKPSEAATVTA